MEYSSAEMTCVLKANTQCEACKVKVMQILKNIRGVYAITIDGEQGTVKVTGKVNPCTLLGVLEKYGRHAELKYVKFDGEVVERSPCYYGEYGYAPHGMEYTYPLLGCPQHQWYQTSLGFFPPPPLPVPPPPPPPPAPPPGPFRIVPPPPPPLAPFWAPPPHPPPMAPFWRPPPLSNVPKEGASEQNKKIVKQGKHCTIM